jgi:hypothetical protein
MDLFPNKCHQIDVETLRALYRFAKRINNITSVMTPEKSRSVCARYCARPSKSNRFRYEPARGGRS